MTAVFLLMMLFAFPMLSDASPCHDFPWQNLEEVQPSENFVRGREAMADALEKDALLYFQKFVQQQPHSPLVEGVRYAMATLISSVPDPSERFLETIGYLRVARQRYPHSPYAPWALCMIGDLYRRGGWFQEAKGALEQFLNTYPGHPLTPGVLVSAGLNFLRHGQNLEGALVFRRVLDEPAWFPFHLEAALGLADGAAASKAWSQAEYWYQTVDLEQPSLIRSSPSSLYLRGLTDLALGKEERAMNQFVKAINLHPSHEEAGRSLVKLAGILFNKGNAIPALWFANQASKRFPGTPSDFQGRAILLRWVLKDLGVRGNQIHESDVRQRLAELGIAVPSSWEQFQEAAGRLALAGGGDLRNEAKWWMGQGYEAQDKTKEAMASYIELLRIPGENTWRTKAGRALKQMLVKFYNQHNWEKFGLFLDSYVEFTPALGPDAELWLVIAEAYREMELPEQALPWYQKILANQSPSGIHEPALAGEVRVAAQLGNAQLMKQEGLKYEQAYPKGTWMGEIALRLGDQAVIEKDLQEAIRQFALADQHTGTLADRLKAERKLVQAQRQHGDIQGAIFTARRLTGEPDSENRDRLMLADMLFEGKQYEDAAAQYQQVMIRENDPEHRLWAMYRLAVSYKNLGNDEEAQRIFVKLQKEIPAAQGIGPALAAVASAVVHTFPQETPKAGRHRGTGN